MVEDLEESMSDKELEEKIWGWATKTFPKQHADKFEELIKIAEAHTKERIAEVLEGVRLKKKVITQKGHEYPSCEDRGYNQAIDDQNDKIDKEMKLLIIN